MRKICCAFISKLPDGYNTIIGENGVKLSGGQNKESLLPELNFKKITLILMDEATSSLDAGFRNK